MSATKKAMNGKQPLFGAVLSIIGSMTLIDWGILDGIITAVLAFAANMYYQRQKNARATPLRAVAAVQLHAAEREPVKTVASMKVKGKLVPTALTSHLA